MCTSRTGQPNSSDAPPLPLPQKKLLSSSHRRQVSGVGLAWAYATIASHNSMDAPPLVLGLVTPQVLIIEEVSAVGAVSLCTLSTAAWLHATQAPGRAHAHAAGSLMLPVATSLVGNDQCNGMFGWFRLHSTLCDDHGVPFIPHPAQFSSLPVRRIWSHNIGATLEPQHTCTFIWYSFPLQHLDGAYRAHAWKENSLLLHTVGAYSSSKLLWSS